MKTFYNICIDKLTLCYTIAENSILHRLTDEDTFIDMGDFRLHRIESGHFKNSFQIISLWDDPDDLDSMSWQVYGILKYSRYTDREDTSKLAWIYFDNKVLYQQLYPNVNTVIFAEYQADILGLELRNITNIDIAVDTNRDAAKAVKYMLRNRNIETILNNKAVNDRNKLINEILYLHKGNLNKYSDLSLYVKQVDKDGFEMKIYNKKKEVGESSHKNYIYQWHNLKPNTGLWRVELSLKHAHIKDFIDDNRIELTHNLFNDNNFLLKCFLTFSLRLLRFKDGNKTISVLDTF